MTRLERELHRPILVDPSLLKDAPAGMSFSADSIPLSRALDAFAAELGAKAWFSRGLYWISKRPPAEVLPEPLELPQLTPDNERAAKAAVADIGNDDFHLREAASQKLLALGPGALKWVDAALASTNDAESRQRLSLVSESLRAPLRDGQPTVRLKIRLRSPVYFRTPPKSLGEAAEILRDEWSDRRSLPDARISLAHILVDEGLENLPVSIPAEHEICGYAAIEWLARTAGCRISIKGNTIRFVKP